MITFNEGVPGSGKSYDAVVSHILPALKEGRTVVARINGLNRAKIAEFLGEPVEWVDEKLIELPSDQVRTACRAIGLEGEEQLDQWVPRDALVVIDECHEFFLAGRQPLPPETEKFFALHRHFGLDVVLISQWYKRLHAALRARIERKTVFVKLNAFGMSRSYVAQHFTTVCPDKFEFVGKAVQRYKPKVFPLYQSVVAGTKNLEVYSAGTQTVWRRFALPGVALLVVAVIAGSQLLAFFSAGSASNAAAGGNKAAGVGMVRTDAGKPAGGVSVANVATVQPVMPQRAPGVEYVASLGKLGRPRLALFYKSATGTRALVEWRNQSNIVVEALTLKQLATLGVSVAVSMERAQLDLGGGEFVIATPWPVDEPVREGDHRLYSLDPERPAGAVPPSVSEPAAATGPALSQSAGNRAPIRSIRMPVDGPGSMPGYAAR